VPTGSELTLSLVFGLRHAFEQLLVEVDNERLQCSVVPNEARHACLSFTLANVEPASDDVTEQIARGLALDG
jgi:hypothetical protein